MKKIINAIRKFAMEKRKAFTLIELMGVLVIIGILTAILIPVINNTIKNNKQTLHEKQIELIKLSAKNLASDNTYILPEEEGEVIYITLGQLRAMGYAEGTIIDPLTKENFPDSLIVMIIKNEKDYNYEIITDKGTLVSESGINVAPPSKSYIKEGTTSTYIITAKTEATITPENKEGKQTEYYINIGKENIKLLGEATEGIEIKYKLEGNSGLYKLTVQGGEKEGYLYFAFNGLKDYEGKEIEVSRYNKDVSEIKNKKRIIVDSTLPTCDWSGENSTWTNNEVKITLTGIKEKDGAPYAPIKSSNIIKTYNQEGIEIKTDDLSYDIEDEAGNKTKCTKTVNVYYDKKAPIITSVSNPTNGNWVNYSFSVTLNASDGGSGLGETQYSYQSNTDWKKDDATINGNIITTSDFTAERNQLAYLRVCDKVGNCSNQKSTQIKIDKTAPTCEWTENTTWTKNNVTVSVVGIDSASGMSSQKENSWTYSAAEEEKDSENLSYVVKDNAGNEKTCSKNVSIKHDTLAPRINGPYQDGCYSGLSGYEKIHFNVEDASGVTLNYNYSYDGSGGCSGPSEITRTYTGDIYDGFRCLGNKIKFERISVRDNAGNVSSLPDTGWLNRSC